MTKPRLTTFGDNTINYLAPMGIGKEVEVKSVSPIEGTNISHGIFIIPSGEKLKPHAICKLVLDDGKSAVIFIVNVAKKEATFCGAFS